MRVDASVHCRRALGRGARIRHPLSAHPAANAPRMASPRRCFEQDDSRPSSLSDYSARGTCGKPWVVLHDRRQCREGRGIGESTQWVGLTNGKQSIMR
jgi:hypothetical protein